MKTILLFIALAITTHSSAQCWMESSKQTVVTAGVMVDYSIKGIHAFNGNAVHVGFWADGIGVFIGYVEYKMSDYTVNNGETQTVMQSSAQRTAAVTIAGRYLLFEENIQIVPFFSVGLANYQNIGISAGYKIADGTYLGIGYSRTGHLSAALTISINSKQ